MRRLFAIAALLVLVPFSAAEAGSVGLAITKNLFDVSVPPGGTYEDKLVIMNWSDIEVPVRIELSPWDLGSEQNQLVFGDENTASDATGWFNLKETSFVLPPLGERELAFSVTAPAANPPGSYFVMMRFVPELPDSAYESQGPKFIPELGALFFIGVSTMSLDGERALYDGRIDQFAPQGRGLSILERFTPLAAAGIFDEMIQKFQVVLENRGLYHFQTKGKLVLTNMIGTPVAHFDVPNRYLLPGHVRTVAIAGTGDTSWWGRYGHFGRYTAHLTLSIPGNDLPVVSEVSFWIFPWQLLLPFGAAAGGIILLRHRLLAAARAFIKTGRSSTR